ncbi:hypothetical protein H5410_018743 [Solanum commersonii]|uniref:Uncharacterized protein n=1 Tax=Solanum commersonii TaxID=4109 RepID=A0A9J6A496_SOLCO|nr:hypothetical protein H5410_018743 [Solanum commersonii]
MYANTLSPIIMSNVYSDDHLPKCIVSKNVLPQLVGGETAHTTWNNELQPMHPDPNHESVSSKNNCVL